MWELGPCVSGSPVKKYRKTMHGHNAQETEKGRFTERCCLQPGLHRLKCYNNDAHALGWKNAHIEIEGHRYCDDFITNVAMRAINILGKTYDGNVLISRLSYS